MTFSLFPELFTYHILAVTVLRVTLGVYVLLLGSRLLARARTRATPALGMWVVGIIHVVLAGLLIVGLYTQAAALGVMCFLSLATNRRLQQFQGGSAGVLVLLFMIAFALLFLGPGAFAVDLPL